MYLTLVITKKMNQLFGIGYNNAFYFVRDGAVETYLSLGDIEEQNTFGKNLYGVYKLAMAQHDRQEKFYAGFIKLLAGAESELSGKLRKKDFVRIFKTLTNAVATAFGYYNTSMPPHFQFLQDVIERAIDSGEIVREDAYLLMTPDRETSFDKERKEWIAIVRGAKNIGIEKEADRVRMHAIAYSYLPSEEGDLVWDEVYYRKLLRHDVLRSKNELTEEANKISERLVRARQFHADAERKKHISKQLREAGEVVRKYAWLRLEMRNVWTKAHAVLSEFLQVLSKECGVHVSDLEYYSVSELQSLLTDGVKVSVKEIRSRQAMYIYQIHNGNIGMLTGEKAKIFSDNHVPREANETQTELKGVVANAGFAKGPVAVLRFHDKNLVEKIDTMKPGSILVAGQTRPQLLPALKKAAAIVTDEGGITSHAAIVSRELGIPCIIATHNATRVLKDGDMVEVDAERGIVRVINRAK